MTRKAIETSSKLTVEIRQVNIDRLFCCILTVNYVQVKDLIIYFQHVYFQHACWIYIS